MVNFGPRDTVPERFGDRLFCQHNATATLMRTTVEENVRIGQEIGCKVAASISPAVILLPLKGVSASDADGQVFHDPDARAALFDAMRQSHAQIEFLESEYHINDAKFAEAAARRLLSLMRGKGEA